MHDCGEVSETPPALPERRGHAIVCGLNALGLRILEVLRDSGIDAVVVDEDPDRRLIPILERWDVAYIPESPRRPEVLSRAGLGDCRAVIGIEGDDLRNLETALMVRSLRPELRTIVQMANAAVGVAVSQLLAGGAALDVAALAAPSLAQACRGASSLHFDIGGQAFDLTETVVTKTGTLRSIYQDLVPIAVVHDSGPLEICPGRDQFVQPGDRVNVLGTAADLTEALGTSRTRLAAPAPPPPRMAALSGGIRSLAQSAGSRLGALIAAILVLTAVATVTLHLGYRLPSGHHMSLLDAAYFTVETISTVGFGDFSYAAQTTWLRVFAIALIILGATSLTALFALITDLLLSRRVADAFGMRRVNRMVGHVVVIGLGSIGLHVVEELRRLGTEVVVIEADRENRHLGAARAADIPVVFGDATEEATLRAANVPAASAVAALTSNDLTNLEAGLSLRGFAGSLGRDLPVVMRIFDRQLGQVIEESFDFRLVRSTSALAAPWFVGAALGLDVLSTFYVERELFLIATLLVAPAGGLAGAAMQDLSARIRVIAIERSGADQLEHPPRRATRFAAGDRAYLIGPYSELLNVLRREQQSLGQPQPAPPRP